MDSNTYITNATRTESVPTQLNVNEVAYHAVLEIAIAAAKLADQFKRRLYYPTPERDVLIDNDVCLENLRTMYGLSQFLGASLEQGVDFNNRTDPADLAAMTRELPEAVRDFQLDKLNVRLNHAALGCFTESGELLEAVKAQYETGIIDKVNFGEEIGGDISWYQAIGIDAAGLNLDEERAKNIGKLKVRFPNKFSSENAVTRDLIAERAVLEKAAV